MSFYLDSFGAVSFCVLDDGYSSQADGDISETHIPRSNITYFDLGGQQPRTFSLTVLMSSLTNFRSLENLRNSAQTLAIPGFTGSALLRSVAEQKRYKSGQVEARLELISL